MERRWVFVLLDVLCVLVGKSLGTGCGNSLPGPRSLGASCQYAFWMRTMVTGASYFFLRALPSLLGSWRDPGCLSTCGCSRCV